MAWLFALHPTCQCKIPLQGVSLPRDKKDIKLDSRSPTCHRSSSRTHPMIHSYTTAKYPSPSIMPSHLMPTYTHPRIPHPIITQESSSPLILLQKHLYPTPPPLLPSLLHPIPPNHNPRKQLRKPAINQIPPLLLLLLFITFIQLNRYE